MFNPAIRRLPEDKGRDSSANEPGVIYGRNFPIAQLHAACMRIARSNATVLLADATGTGVDVYARFAHGPCPLAKPAR
jgi:DNA-binding NtrC family response regulator